MARQLPGLRWSLLATARATAISPQLPAATGHIALPASSRVTTKSSSTPKAANPKPTASKRTQARQLSWISSSPEHPLSTLDKEITREPQRGHIYGAYDDHRPARRHGRGRRRAYSTAFYRRCGR